MWILDVFFRLRPDDLPSVSRVGENGRIRQKTLAASIGQLNALLNLHPRPIKLVVASDRKALPNAREASAFAVPSWGVDAKQTQAEP